MTYPRLTTFGRRPTASIATTRYTFECIEGGLALAERITAFSGAHIFVITIVVRPAAASACTAITVIAVLGETLAGLRTGLADLLFGSAIATGTVERALALEVVDAAIPALFHVLADRASGATGFGAAQRAFTATVTALACCERETCAGGIGTSRTNGGGLDLASLVSAVVNQAGVGARAAFCIAAQGAFSIVAELGFYPVSGITKTGFAGFAVKGVLTLKSGGAEV